MALSFDAKKNFAYSTVATAPSPATSGTSLVVGAGHGALFPAVPFNAVVWPDAVQPTPANAEIVRVTTVTTDTFTITRTQEGTSARTIIATDQIALNITAKSITDIEGSFTTASQLTVPIGTVAMWFTDTAPTNWLLLRGQAINRTTYASLFTLWSTTYGVGDGSTTFNVPDMQTRIPIGKATSGLVGTLGGTTGTLTHTHGVGSLTVASHTHSGVGSPTQRVEAHTHTSGTLAVASHSHGAGTFANTAHSHTYTPTTVWVDAVGGGNQEEVLAAISIANETVAFSGDTGSYAPAVTSGDTGGASEDEINTGVTGATAPAVSTGASAGADPPVLVVNFMVRALSGI